MSKKASSLISCSLFTAFSIITPALAENTEQGSTKKIGNTHVVVSAMKDDRVIEESATSITQISDKTIDRIGASSLQDALRYDASVNVDNTASGNLSDVRIRGIGDNRVMIMIDGSPVPSSFTFGEYLKVDRGYFDIDSMKSIDVIKGPISMLYGSSALAGGIFMRTKDPIDFIQDGNRYGGEVKLGFQSASRNRYTTLTGAVKFTDEISGMIRGTVKRHHELENYHGKSSSDRTVGEKRDTPNPNTSTVTNILTKLVYEPNNEHKFSLSYENYHNKSDTDSLSLINKSLLFGRYKQLSGSTETINRRSQLTLRHDFNTKTPLFDKGNWVFYWQNTNARQTTYEARQGVTRPLIGTTIDRNRISYYKSEQFGFNAEFYKLIALGSVTHEFTYGFNAKQNTVKTMRYGSSINIKTGKSAESEIFPNQSFPDSKVREYGLFLQDRIGFLDNTVEIIAGLRYDHYAIKPKHGGYFISSNPGTEEPENFSEGKLSKRLAVLFYPIESHTLYANYSEGFNAPSFSAVNTGFSNTAVGYMTKSNPNLKPETSKNFELGWNFNNGTHEASIAVFYSKYDNFIEELQDAGRDPLTGTMIFQAVNLDKSYIYGAEAKVSLPITQFQNGNSELRFDGSIAYAKGKVKSTKEPIDSVEPLTAIMGLSYHHNEQAYVGLMWKLVKDKPLNRISSSLQNSGVTRVPGYGTLDLVAEYKPTKDISINMGIYNILDKKYWTWGNRMTLKDRYSINRGSEPGINAALSLKINF